MRERTEHRKLIPEQDPWNFSRVLLVIIIIVIIIIVRGETIIFDIPFSLGWFYFLFIFFTLVSVLSLYIFLFILCFLLLTFL